MENIKFQFLIFCAVLLAQIASTAATLNPHHSHIFPDICEVACDSVNEEAERCIPPMEIPQAQDPNINNRMALYYTEIMACACPEIIKATNCNRCIKDKSHFNFQGAWYFINERCRNKEYMEAARIVGTIAGSMPVIPEPKYLKSNAPNVAVGRRVVYVICLSALLIV